MNAGTYTSPNGVEHALTVKGDCVTCGKPHLDPIHKHTVERYIGTPCDLVGEYGGYPYVCGMSEKHPDALVVTCNAHRTWWVAL